MGIFLCFSNTSLLLSILCKELAKCICNLFFYKRNLLICNRNIIFCKTYKCSLNSFSTFKPSKFIVTECSRNLSCTVRTEVKEDDRIIVLNGCCRSSVLLYNRRQYEFIRCIFIIRCLDSFRSAYRFFSFTVYQCTISLFNTISTIITIHCIVTPHDRCHFADTNLIHLSN